MLKMRFNSVEIRIRTEYHPMGVEECEEVSLLSRGGHFCLSRLEGSEVGEGFVY